MKHLTPTESGMHSHRLDAAGRGDGTLRDDTLRDWRIAELECVQCESGARIAALEGEIAILRQQLARLEKLLPPEARSPEQPP